MRRTVGAEEKLWVTLSNDGAQRRSIRWVFGDGFAEGERRGDNVVDRQREMMRSDGCDDIGRQSLDLGEEYDSDVSETRL